LHTVADTRPAKSGQSTIACQTALS
jgi:hypothetical protein